MKTKMLYWTLANHLMIACLTTLLFVGSSFTTLRKDVLNNCPFYVGLEVQGDSNVKFALEKGGNSNSCTVRYLRNGVQMSGEQYVPGTSLELDKLESGTYCFIFKLYCDNNEVQTIIIDDIMI